MVVRVILKVKLFFESFHFGEEQLQDTVSKIDSTQLLSVIKRRENITIENKET